MRTEGFNSLHETKGNHNDCSFNLVHHETWIASAVLYARTQWLTKTGSYLDLHHLSYLLQLTGIMHFDHDFHRPFTGMTGHIGSHVALYSFKQGWTIHTTGRIPE
jgi:hypothetical protein